MAWTAKARAAALQARKAFGKGTGRVQRSRAAKLLRYTKKRQQITVAKGVIRSAFKSRNDSQYGKIHRAVAREWIKDLRSLRKYGTRAPSQYRSGFSSTSM